jgi:protein SCO1/2
MKRTLVVFVSSLLIAGSTTLTTTSAFASTPKPTSTSKSGGMAGMNMAAPTPPPISGTAAMMGGTILDAAIPASITNIPLVDASGKSFTLAALKGKTIVLTDFFTSCDMICPMTSANMRDIAAAVAQAGKSSSVDVIELSVDPKRDNVSRIHAYQSLYGAATWTMATGTPANITQLWNWFGVYTKEVPNTDGDAVDWQTGKPLAYDVEHDDVVMILGPNLHFRWIDLGNPAVANPNTVPAKLKAFLSAQGKLNLLKPQQPDWTNGAVYGALQQIFGLNIGPKMKM